MSIKLKIGDVEVTCDKPEEAMLLAGSIGAIKGLKIPDVSKLLEKPITLRLNGAEMVCENPASAASMLVVAGVLPKQKHYSAEARGAQGSGPTRAWQLAEAYGEKHGMSKDAAKRLIATKKKEVQAKARLGSMDAQDRLFMQELKDLAEKLGFSEETPEVVESKPKKKK